MALEEGRNDYRSEGHLVKPIYSPNSQRPSGGPCNSDSQGQIGIGEIRPFCLSRGPLLFGLSRIIRYRLKSGLENWQGLGRCFSSC